MYYVFLVTKLFFAFIVGITLSSLLTLVFFWHVQMVSKVVNWWNK